MINRQDKFNELVRLIREIQTPPRDLYAIYETNISADVDLDEYVFLGKLNPYKDIYIKKVE